MRPESCVCGERGRGPLPEQSATCVSNCGPSMYVCAESGAKCPAGLATSSSTPDSTFVSQLRGERRGRGHMSERRGWRMFSGLFVPHSSVSVRVRHQESAGSKVNACVHSETGARGLSSPASSRENWIQEFSCVALVSGMRDDVREKSNFGDCCVSG